MTVPVTGAATGSSPSSTLKVATLALTAFTGLLGTGTVYAQAYQCAVPATLAPVRPVTPDGPSLQSPVSSYTLAASWSPDYCKTSGETRSMQCDKRHGRFGFVLHGLWPEAARGAPPQWCAPHITPSPQALRPHLCMTPSPTLLAREWAKHGSCMAKTPEQYFRVSSILWQSLHWPDADQLSRRKDLTVGDLRDAFLAQNRGWRRDAIGMEVSRTGWLREIHLCYGKDFKPTRCTPHQFGPADATALKIWRGL